MSSPYQSRFRIERRGARITRGPNESTILMDPKHWSTTIT